MHVCCSPVGHCAIAVGRTDRTAQVTTVNHVKQVCTDVRPAADEELPTIYVEEFRYALVLELSKFADEDYPKECSVYCTAGKDVEGEVELKGKTEVIAHYFEEGNVQLDTTLECKESTLLQAPKECGSVITNIGNEVDLTLVDLEGLLPSAIIMVVSVTASTTNGKPLSEENLQKTFDACDRALALDAAKKKVLDFVLRVEWDTLHPICLLSLEVQLQPN
eukprot:Gb_32658 [translate_table: standard]